MQEEIESVGKLSDIELMTLKYLNKDMHKNEKSGT